MIEPIPAYPTSKDEMYYAILTRIFDARKEQASRWPSKHTWVAISQADCASISIDIEPLPFYLALLAQSLRFEFPAGIVVFYLDYKHTQHVRAGDVTNHFSPRGAVAFLRKHGCAVSGLCFSRGQAAILEVLTWPTQTRRTPHCFKAVSSAVKHVKAYVEIARDT